MMHFVESLWIRQRSPFTPLRRALSVSRKQGTFNDLYWTTGDGGPQTDPYGASQNVTNLLGSMIRISVPTVAGYTSSDGLPYAIPAGNYQGVYACIPLCNILFTLSNAVRCSDAAAFW